MKTSSPQRITFLYLNGVHHIYHTALTAMELSLLQEEYPVELLSCSPAHTAILEQIGGLYPDNRCKIIQLKLPFRFKYLNFKGKSYPSPTLNRSRLKRHVQNSAAIIATSHPLAASLRKLGITRARYFYQYHGCGDRKYGFDPKLSQFDTILVPGSYYQERLAREKIADTSKTAVIGYPKLDYPVDTQGLRQSLFKSDKPVVLYAPHWHPEHTSFKAWGRDIANFFQQTNNYNLIFAPHILIKHWKHHYKYDINFDQYKSNCIHFDFGSQNSVNTAYLQIADLYMGDVSGMVYEWLAIRPRPCVFLNPHKVEWRDNPEYRFWEFGAVVDEISDLGTQLKLSLTDDSYETIQRSRLQDQINITSTPSSQRAAAVIYQIVNSRP